MKIVSPLPHKRGRLEIIPLIDIMFFLLAAFMVVSIGKIHVKSLKVSLPTDVPAAQKEAKEDFISISISSEGVVQLDKDIVPTKDALLARLQDLYAKNKEQKFLIAADREARHGDVLDVLGRLRSAGFQKIGFSTKSEQLAGGAVSSSPVSTGASAAPSSTSVPDSAQSSTTSLAPPPDSVSAASTVQIPTPASAPTAPGN
jgi:biopolymer transport protein ExbD